MKKQFAWILWVLLACGSSVERDQLFEFHRKYVQQFPIEKAVFNDTLAVYLDFSKGMKAAYAPIKNNFLSKISAFDKYQLFKVGQHIFAISNLQILDSTQNFQDSLSVLPESLQKIVNQSQQAVLITDFEYVPNSQKNYRAVTLSADTVMTAVNPYPWASKYFEKWLSEGNQIDVWTIPFQSWKVQKLLYFIVFTPKNTEKERFLKLFAKEKFAHFCFTSVFDKSLEKRNYTQFHGGLQNIEAIDFADKSAWNFEFYSLHQTDLEKKISKDSVFLKNIFVKTDTNFVHNFKTSIKTWDISQIYSQYQETLKESSPAIKIDPETKDTFLLSAPDIAFRFTGGILNNNLLALQTDSISGELGLKLQQIPRERKLLYVEIYVENALFSPNKTLKTALSYRNEQNFLMTAFYESINLAMQKVYCFREKKLLKTYYILVLD